MTRTVYMLTTGRYYMIRLGIDIMHLHMMFMNVSLISASNVENNKKNAIYLRMLYNHLYMTMILK